MAKRRSEIPADMQAAAKEAHGVLVEAAAEGEDTLLEKYLENGALSDEELIRGLKKVVQSGAFVPVYCAAGGHSLGVVPLLNGIVDLLPSPAQATPRAARRQGWPREVLTATRCRAAGCLCVEDDRGPVRGQDDVLPGLLGLRAGRCARVESDQERRRANVWPSHPARQGPASGQE